MKNTENSRNILSLSICALVAVGLLIVANLVSTRGATEDEKMTDWLKRYSSATEEASFEKYSGLALSVANVVVGLDIKTEEYTEATGLMSGKAKEQFDSMLRVSTVGTAEQDDTNVDVVLDEIMGGTDNTEADRYRMSIVGSNFYYPDVYVYKLVNESGNSVIVTFTINSDGSVTSVKASI